MRKVAFDPIVNQNSVLLLLGTMPGDESLRLKQYYGHKNNQFWKILFALFEQPVSKDYSKKIQLLLDNKIALWDVLHSCECKGSADADIKNEEVNDFQSFFSNYPGITHVVFDSKKAEDFYSKYIGFDKRHTFLRLPSPSTANARYSLEEKTEQWKIILPILQVV